MSENSEGENNDQKKPSLEELQKQVETLNSVNEGLVSTNERLLNQSKDWKSQLRAIEQKVDQKETENLEGKKDFQGLYERSLQKIEELSGSVMEAKRDGLKSTLKYEVSKHAKDAHSVDDVIFNLSKNKDAFAYNKEKDTWEGIEDAINDLRTSRADMFDREKLRMENGRPNKVPANEKTIDQLIEENP